MFSKRFNIIFIIFLIIFNSCFRNKNPINSEENYFYKWPEKITATGIGARNINIPLPQQRAGALRAARLDFIRKLRYSVINLSISDTLSVEKIMIINWAIEGQINDYIRNYHFITDTLDLPTGDVQIDGFIKTKGIKTIIKQNIL